MLKHNYISLDPKEQKLYDKLRRDSYAKLETGGQITAQTVLIQLLRLQQLAGGFLVEDDAPKPRLIHRKKLDAIVDILIDYVLNEQKKLVIFARFLPEILAIIQLSNSILERHSIKTVSIYGNVKKEKRGERIQ